MPGASEALHAGEAVGSGGFRRDPLPRVESWREGGLVGAAG